MEQQRNVLDRLAVRAEQLTDLLKEAQKMDRLIEVYEARIHAKA